MDKQALSIKPITAGLAAAAAGAVGGGTGYVVAKAKAKKALTNQVQEFSAYNEQENQAIADDAFNQGIEYAVATTKQSSLKGVDMEKEAGPRITALKNALKNLYYTGIKRYVGDMRKAKHLIKREGYTPEAAKAIKSTMRGANRNELYKNLLALSATGAGAGGAAYLGLRKSSSLSKHSGPRFDALKAEFKNLFYSGYGARKTGLENIKAIAGSNMSVKDAIPKIQGIAAGYRRNVAKNLLMSGGAGLGLAGAGVGAYDLAKSSSLEKDAGAKTEAIKNFLKRTYTSGLTERSKTLAALKAPGHDFYHNPVMGAAAYRQEIAKNLLAAAGTAGVLGGAGYGVSKISSLEKDATAKERFEAITAALKNVYGSGFKARKEAIAKSKTMPLDPLPKTKSAYRQEIAKNLLAMAGTAGAVGGAGYGVSQI